MTDTERLDWLERQKIIIKGYHRYWQKYFELVKDKGEPVFWACHEVEDGVLCAYHGATIREAIDAAMEGKA